MRRWKNYQGLHATYGNLLELFVNAGHTQCAEAVCEVLRKKCESSVLVTIVITLPAHAQQGVIVHSIQTDSFSSNSV